MHLLSCIHPPGGATALAAVIGGPAINELGYSYLLTPVLLNVAALFIIAVSFNYFFPWRRYPAASVSRFTETPKAYDSRMIERDALEQAIKDLGLVMDTTTRDLQQLFRLSLKHAAQRQLTPQQIKLHRYYTNGKHGREWAVRRIIDESWSADPRKDMVIYRVVEGQGFNSARSCTRDDFCRWAAREVFASENT
jgi:hypothetical protein